MQHVKKELLLLQTNRIRKVFCGNDLELVRVLKGGVVIHSEKSGSMEVCSALRRLLCWSSIVGHQENWKPRFGVLNEMAPKAANGSVITWSQSCSTQLKFFAICSHSTALRLWKSLLQCLPWPHMHWHYLLLSSTCQFGTQFPSEISKDSQPHSHVNTET